MIDNPFTGREGKGEYSRLASPTFGKLIKSLKL
jgi:hypothetical protein